jgi:nitrite reductase/ring-hydroxylating ferredoxin subunit/uncharacterized membrane protein
MTRQAPTLSAVIERLPWLDQIAEPLQAAAQQVFGASGAMQKAKDWLNGTPLRHRLHPALIVVPLGAWTAAALLDTLDATEEDGRWSDSADLLIGAGIVGALPTAASGLADWVDLYDHQRRVGVAHALVNSAALSLYIGSFALRLSGKRGAARTLAGFGFGLVTLGGMLGGDLVYNLGANVTHLLYPKPPDEFTDACASLDLPEGRARVVELGRVPVLLRRHLGKIEAVEAWCPHAGGPLEPENIEGDEVSCPWHGSRFCLRDGKPTQGPASAPLRTFDVREAGGRILLKPSDETKTWPPAPEPPAQIPGAPTLESAAPAK